MDCRKGLRRLVLPTVSSDKLRAYLIELIDLELRYRYLKKHVLHLRQAFMYSSQPDQGVKVKL